MSSASRFALMGDGGFTTIEGEKCSMLRGDLIINPNGAWHDHGNEGSEPVIWVDVLDLPMAEALNSSYFDFEYNESSEHSNSAEPLKRRAQSITAPIDYSSRLYATGGIMPKFVSHKRGKGFGSPMYVYRWRDTYLRLQQLRALDGDPRDGIIVEYVDPVNGRAVLPTLSFRVQLLKSDFEPQWQRKTASTLFCVVQGEGRAEVDGDNFEWKENDVFVVPSWHWYRNINTGNDDLILFSVSDSPALEKLGFFRSQGKSKAGEIVDLVADYRGITE
jgi:gentisate 1,2-dioxygenase